MTPTFDWSRNRDMWIRVLLKQTGQSLETWNARVAARGFNAKEALRTWLGAQGVTGYAQSLLVMERFGYPDFLTATASELIDGQYADRPALRPIYELVVAAAAALGETAVQARKGYVSLLTPRRTFARIQPTTRTRIDLGLRLEAEPAGRLRPSRIHPTMRLQVALSSESDFDDQVRGWLERAYSENI